MSSTSNDFWTLNNGNYFIPVCCFIFFNLGDYIGRFVAEYIQWPKPGKVGMIIVFVLSIVRVAFIPLFLQCNIPRGGPESLPTGNKHAQTCTVQRLKIENVQFWRATRCGFAKKLLKNAKNHRQIVEIWPFL